MLRIGSWRLSVESPPFLQTTPTPFQIHSNSNPSPRHPHFAFLQQPAHHQCCPWLAWRTTTAASSKRPTALGGGERPQLTRAITATGHSSAPSTWSAMCAHVGLPRTRVIIAMGNSEDMLTRTIRHEGEALYLPLWSGFCAPGPADPASAADVPC
jgi:hypothetical protein